MLGYGVLGTIAVIVLVVWLVRGGCELVTCMRSPILAFCGMLLLGSTAAFLLYVSILSILTVVVILMAVMLMFLLGAQVERQRLRVQEILSEKTMPPIQQTHTLLDAQGSSVLEARVQG